MAMRFPHEARRGGGRQRGRNDGAPLPARYFRYFRAWVAPGTPAFLSLVAVFYLMVAKPV